ncbi:SDR family NAD(P)-dependent oxidoreductase, partial [Eubacteriales bacterium OttesenSCG-928-N13]|nr:SDR family NAD(P)-dependent oxidoreductase [Eubacteriales bacterium OttesenSCG-928-N13]
MKPFDLSGKVALVTGGARGLGNVIAKGLLEAGATVILNDVSEDALERAASEFRAMGYETPIYAFDVSNEAQVEAAIESIERKHPIDVLINNAGIHKRDMLIDMPIENWRKVIDVNLTGAFVVGRCVARGMIGRESGKIINIASLNAQMVRPNIGNYSAAKGGLVTLTKSMATEWGPYGICVNAIGPGYFLTDLTQPLADDQAFDAWVKSEVPLRRWGDPTDIIGLTLLLSSPASDYIS